MSKSMTGYGAAEFSIRDDKFSLEINSVNQRFIEINVKTPNRFSLLENRIRDKVKEVCSRGSLSLSINRTVAAAGGLNVNIPLAKQYLGVLKKIQKSLGLKGKIDISLLLQFKDIFSSGEIMRDLEGDWNRLKHALKTALDALVKMRKEEGAVLAKDIALRLNILKDILSKMDERSPLVAETYREKLKQRMANILGDTAVDEARLLTEVAVFAEKSDITEELVRLNGHLTQVKGLLKRDEPVGRKMDFLCQEILREINTMGSKANDFELANLVVSAKAELEKIREQVQNIE